MTTIDGRCSCSRCQARTGDIYRMIGSCQNCRGGPFLMLFRSGDQAHNLACPTCGNFQTVVPDRLATDNEIPVAVG